jgi:hypothetical protein
MEEGNVANLIWAREQDGLLPFSISKRPLAQVSLHVKMALACFTFSIFAKTFGKFFCHFRQFSYETFREER